MKPMHTLNDIEKEVVRKLATAWGILMEMMITGDATSRDLDQAISEIMAAEQLVKSRGLGGVAKWQ